MVSLYSADCWECLHRVIWPHGGPGQSQGVVAFAMRRIEEGTYYCNKPKPN